MMWASTEGMADELVKRLKGHDQFVVLSLIANWEEANSELALANEENLKLRAIIHDVLSALPDIADGTFADPEWCAFIEGRIRKALRG